MSDRYLGKLVGYDEDNPLSGILILKFEHGDVPFDKRMACEFIDRTCDEPPQKYEIEDGSVFVIED
jgi:hypothetical protein